MAKKCQIKFLLSNPDNIFKKRTQESVIEEKNIEKEFALVEYKESIFKKLINKIKNISDNTLRQTRCMRKSSLRAKRGQSCIRRLL